MGLCDPLQNGGKCISIASHHGRRDGFVGPEAEVAMGLHEVPCGLDESATYAAMYRPGRGCMHPGWYLDFHFRFSEFGLLG
jgi:hypothetical protein